MKITILDKFKVKEYIPKEKAAIIRIEDIYHMKKLKHKYELELNLYFSDLNYE